MPCQEGVSCIADRAGALKQAYPPLIEVDLMRKTKIHATIGPASRERPVLAEMMQKGLDGCRLNFSHTPESQARKIVAHARDIAHQLKKPFAIRQDLQGPKLRVGEMQGHPQLTAGQRFVIEPGRGIGNGERAFVDCPELFEAITAGTRLVLADGKITLGVEKKQARRLFCEVLSAEGTLDSRKGISAPEIHLKMPALTEKDKKDFEAGVRLGVDVVSLSFVKNGADIEALRSLMRRMDYQGPVIAKIELPEAVDNLDAIIEAADGLAVARGDLQVAYPPAALPFLQRKIIRACNQKGKFVMIGSGVLSSMLNHPGPTLADVSDIFLAVESRPDVISFSDETAVGRYPVQCVETMDKLISEMEARIEGHAPDTDPVGEVHPPSTAIRAAKAGGRNIIVDVPGDEKLANWLTMHRGVHVAPAASGPGR